MSSEDKKHEKHAKLALPAYGRFHRNEWAILGAPCGDIRQLAFGVIGRLSSRYRLAYADADHAAADADAAAGQSPGSAMGHGAKMEYTDKINYHRFDIKARLDVYQYRQYFNEQDAVLVNGNHFGAGRQIVIVDARKEESLKRKMDRLGDVRLILLSEGAREVFPWLRDSLENFADIPQMKIQDVAGISILLEKELEAARPPLYGLVLAGGQSQRMGIDKGLIEYYGMPQRDYIARLLAPLCEKTFISCRPDQAEEVANPLPDTFPGLGPFGAIASAFRRHPDAAWLVAACDLPLLDKETIAQLIGYRNPSKVATAFNSPVNEFPEPLIAIWEPRSYPILLQFLAQGYSCPRKVLINSNVELLNAGKPDALRNVNSPEEMEEAIALIKALP